MGKLITYFVAEDRGGKLEAAAKLACNFWNSFVEPDHDTVVRLELLWRLPWSATTAIANNPLVADGTRHGRVKFRTKYAKEWPVEKIAGTIAHEIGHVLGYGFKEWEALIDRQTAGFRADAISRLPALAEMRLQRRGGKGVAWSHWDEATFDPDLMTPYKDVAATVMPVTIDVLELMGHRVLQRLSEPTSLASLLQNPPPPVQDWSERVSGIDRERTIQTDVMEIVPHEG